MTEILDTVFKFADRFCDDSWNVVIPLIREAFTEEVCEEFERQNGVLQDRAESFRPLRDSLDPEARLVKLAQICFMESVLDGIQYNCPEDHLDEMAGPWPHEPEAVSKDVITFFEKNGCGNFAALVRVAAAQMAPPEPVSPPPEAPSSQPDRKLRTLLDEYGLKPQGGPLFI